MSAVSVEKLKTVVDRALDDEAYADRLFTEPEAIAKEAGLSESEALVVKQMNREQFDVARKDAEKTAASGELSDHELENVAGGATIGSFSTTSSMIIGRSLISATGGSYQNLAAAGCGCCGWAGSIGSGALTLPAGP